MLSHLWISNMQFLAQDEARLLQKKPDRQIADKPMRRLYDAPGHRFERGEADSVSQAIEFALQLG
jgi:hypothetical protein